MLECHNISKRYDDRHVLRDVSVKIEHSQTTAIVGPSGSGKTTLARILSFLEEPDLGYVTYLQGARPLYDSRSESSPPWPDVSCVFQRQFLWPHMTIFENISTPLKNQTYEDKKTRIREIVDLFGMKEFLDRYPHQVSGGEAQRACLARALALDPSILILDEAHTFLDLAQQIKLNHYLRTLKSSGIGLCIVTHSLSFIKKEADTIIVLEDGQITEHGDKEILRTPTSKFLNEVCHLI